MCTEILILIWIMWFFCPNLMNIAGVFLEVCTDILETLGLLNQAITNNFLAVKYISTQELSILRDDGEIFVFSIQIAE